MELAQSTGKTFSIDELQDLTQVPRRTIRYYIEYGLLEGPEGETRAARYTQQHLETLLKIRRLTAEGVGLAHVKRRLEQEAAGQVATDAVAAGAVVPSIEVRSHLHLASGVELVIEPGAARLSPEQLRRFMREALDALARAREEEKKE